MGIFSAILDKLRHHGASSAQAAGGQQTSGAAQQPQQQGQQSAQSGAQQRAQPSMQQPSQTTGQQQAQPGGQAAQQQGANQASMQNVDVEAVLSQMASQKGGGGNYRQSIVDLLKLLDLDSSLAARKELAEELNVHSGAAGSAEQNIALHKAVMRKIAENGGKVPESMKH